ncbi:hypothetical protein KKH23_09615 [Patescibacteria group bacterium]|nr:hypothetical protein [Patescibacteria group bacterium]
MLKYTPKLYLVFKLPNGTTHSGFFRQNQRLGDMVTALCPDGKIQLDQSKTIGELGLKNDDVTEVKKFNPHKLSWPFK